MMAFPVLLFLIAISATFKPGINTAMIAIGAVSWPPMARLMRGQVLMLKSREFIFSAEALGFSHLRILFFHILPNCLAPIIVTFTLGISGAIMAEASLSLICFVSCRYRSYKHFIEIIINIYVFSLHCCHQIIFLLTMGSTVSLKRPTLPSL